MFIKKYLFVFSLLLILSLSQGIAQNVLVDTVRGVVTSGDPAAELVQVQYMYMGVSLP